MSYRHPADISIGGDSVEDMTSSFDAYVSRLAKRGYKP